MADVNLHIDGRTYNVYCDDGQESRLKSLAAYVDQRVKEIAGPQNAANKSQALILTTLLLADELFELRDALTRSLQQAETMRVPAPPPVYQGLDPRQEKAIGDEIAKLATRIETLASRVQSL